MRGGLFTGFTLMVIALFLSIIDPHAGWAALGIIGGFMSGVCFADMMEGEE